MLYVISKLIWIFISIGNPPNVIVIKRAHKRPKIELESRIFAKKIPKAYQWHYIEVYFCQRSDFGVIPDYSTI